MTMFTTSWTPRWPPGPLIRVTQDSVQQSDSREVARCAGTETKCPPFMSKETQALRMFFFLQNKCPVPEDLST